MTATTTSTGWSGSWEVMTKPVSGPRPLTPQVLIEAYSHGIFPMAKARDSDEIYRVHPQMRGVLPLDAFHVPRSLRNAVRRKAFQIRCDTACERVIRACAEPRQDDQETWINDDVIHVFTELHRLGYVHSVEAWRDERLVGGLYGMALGGAFFGESMFSAATDASKVALVHLVARLRLGGFRLLDVQFVTEHLRRFGTVEIPAFAYHRLLAAALPVNAVFYSELGEAEEASALATVFSQSMTQTS